MSRAVDRAAVVSLLDLIVVTLNDQIGRLRPTITPKGSGSPLGARREGRQIESRYKVVISGDNLIEVYEYERPVRVGARGRQLPEFDEETGEIIEKDKPPQIERREDSNRRARMELRRIINANFDVHDKFITLTFAENIKDVNQANEEFTGFMRRMKKRFDKFKYAAVIEFQQRGAVHYHMIAKLPYIEKQELAEIWRQGFVKINDITNQNDGKGVDNVGAYVTAYMTKEQSDPRLMGKKAYFTSQGLVRPVTVHGIEAIELIEAYQLEQKKEVYASCYESEHQGLISYKEYNFKRKPMES